MPVPADCYHVIVHGSGFAGSLLAIILQSRGLAVCLIDRGGHPRFAIGESSTPAADLILAELCHADNLPELAPLAHYGSWKSAYPQVRCGLKRGFSYFHQRPGQAFLPDADHSNELLVAASTSDELGDTQWYRPAVDLLFSQVAARKGVQLLEKVSNLRFEMAPDAEIGVIVRGEQAGRPLRIQARFFVDGGGAQHRLLSSALTGSGAPLRTWSRAIFGHFQDVVPWRDVFANLGGNQLDHPFLCDQAAVHQILEGAWMWQLGFDDGLLSAGLVLDETVWPLDQNLTAVQEWNGWLARYPSLQEQFQAARPGPYFSNHSPLIRTGRLQHQVQRAAGAGWALLPFTAGFVDPMFSTGIAHSLLAVQRLSRILTADLSDQQRMCELDAYSTGLLAEFDLIDELVHLTYKTLGQDPRLLHAATMLYFAAVTTWEQRRVAGDRESAFLLATDTQWRAILRSCKIEIESAATDHSLLSGLHTVIAEQIAPFNHVGLFRSGIPNMYRYTAVDEPPS